MSVLLEMFENLLSQPITILYPKQKVPVPGAFRGRLKVESDKCIGCGRCSLVCPAQAVTMVADEREVEFKGNMIKRKKRPEVKIFRCIRCGLCQRYCPTEAIYFTSELSGSGTDREVIVA